MKNNSPGKDISPQDLIDNIPLVTSNLDPIVVEVGNTKIGGGNFVVMAGPNLVENEDMIFEIALSVKSAGVNMLRGGAFKPLTFPYRSEKYFETGLSGLKWLNAASKEVGIPCVSEVTDINNLDEMLPYIDMLQIGTRNMQNFPLLKECARSGHPILLKRGFGSSLRDWLGAAEYILHAGNTNLVLCERGVVAPHTHRDTSRFLLDLQVIPALRELSFLPIITDPSHATFWASWVPYMAYASIGAGADGLMLEVHHDPKNAAVDPLQPISFSVLNDVMKKVRALLPIHDKFIN